MSRLATGEAAAKDHAQLVQRAVTAMGSAVGNPVAIIRSKGDPHPDHGPACVTLEQGQVNRLTRGAKRGHFRLTYCDPAATGPLAALLAALTENGGPIAVDPEAISILAMADRLAASDIPVMVTGPTGTGKEVISRFIHDRSLRKDHPFIAVNCAALPEVMLEALLFGHKKGAFTGADEANQGFFQAAHRGTLLLDEIAEISFALQAKLLRVLQEGEVVPLGATRPVAVDIRIIACTNRDLPTEVAEGRFRPDLYYRLNGFPLVLKSLRERTEDIAPLAFALAMRHSTSRSRLPWISESALALLRLHDWPGNVRELENVVRRALLLANDEPEISAHHIVFDQAPRSVTATNPLRPERGDKHLAEIVHISEAKAIMQTLDACGGNRIRAARQLGISERTLRYRLAAFRDAGLAVAGARR